MTHFLQAAIPMKNTCLHVPLRSQVGRQIRSPQRKEQVGNKHLVTGERLLGKEDNPKKEIHSVVVDCTPFLFSASCKPHLHSSFFAWSLRQEKENIILPYLILLGEALVKWQQVECMHALTPLPCHKHPNGECCQKHDHSRGHSNPGNRTGANPRGGRR